jgi:tetratricopeptide (TPR) repeat protein
MKKLPLYLVLSLLVSLGPGLAFAQPAGPSGKGRLGVSFGMPHAFATPGGQAGGSVWKSQDEYNDYTAMAGEKDPQKKVALADAFLAKYTDSAPAVKVYVYAQLLQASQQTGDSAKAIDAARKLLEVDPNNLEALRYLSFAFPFTFKPDNAEASAQLSRAESDAKHGLDILAKFPKPETMSDEQFQQVVKPVRATFNSAIGFVALQRKDYVAAITSLKAALEDNPNDMYVAYRIGVAYLMSTPPDYNNGFWNLSRAVSIGKSAKATDVSGIETYLKQAYINYHGNEDGLSDIITQAATSPNPPADFQVAVLKPPPATGNPNVDNFNQVTFPLTLGGPRAEQAWPQLKGQPLGLGGFVNSVEKGTDPNTYIVRIAMDSAKASSSFDIELKDSTQPKAGDLAAGDPVRFQGTISAYTRDPSFHLTLDDGKINDDDLEAASQKRPRRSR